MKKLRVAFIGNLCDNAVFIEELLRSEELQTSVHLSCKELEDSMATALFGNAGLELDERVDRLRRENPRVHIWDHSPRSADKPRWRRKWTRGLALLKLLWDLRRADAIFSFAMYHLVALLSGRPYLVFSTGADLHEIAVEKTLRGWLMRKAFQNARSVRISFDPVSRRNATRLKLRISGPYLIPWTIPDRPCAYPGDDGPVRIFMPSRQDWTDPDRERLAKGNDRFIRAWARRVREGWDADLTIVEYGDDVEAAKKLVEELGVASRVRYVPRLNHIDLQKSIEAADLVADQFDQGTPGILALNTLATGRALAIFWDEFCSQFAYSGPPPVLNGKSEEELYQVLGKHDSRAKLRALGEQGHQWMSREYDPERIRSQMRFAISLATGVPLDE